jgi:hypothetical protein
MADIKMGMHLTVLPFHPANNRCMYMVPTDLAVVADIHLPQGLVSSLLAVRYTHYTLPSINCVLLLKKKENNSKARTENYQMKVRHGGRSPTL